MNKADELRAVKNAAGEELTAARIQLSAAQSRFAEANKKYNLARDAWVSEVEKTL